MRISAVVFFVHEIQNLTSKFKQFISQTYSGIKLKTFDSELISFFFFHWLIYFSIQLKNSDGDLDFK